MAVAAIIVRGWRIYCTLAGFGVIALTAAFGVVRIYSPESPVATHRIVAPLPTKVPAGGELVYYLEYERFRPCKGYISETFTALTSFPPNNYRVQMTLKRPVSSTEVKSGDLKISTISPPVIVGPAHYKSILVSQCPEGERNDTVAEINYEATTP